MNPVAAWAQLEALVNGRSLMGTPGVRDPDAACEAFDPAGEPFEEASGDGRCDTDGHYLCRECRLISTRALRRRRNECEVCETSLVVHSRGGRDPLWCPKCDRF